MQSLSRVRQKRLEHGGFVPRQWLATKSVDSKSVWFQIVIRRYSEHRLERSIGESSFTLFASYDEAYKIKILNIERA